jgi:SAM-dependent methyltransferase
MQSTQVTSRSGQRTVSIRTDGCDLCQARDAVVLAEGSSESCPLVICTQCRLIYAWPQLSATALDNFYEDTFANDPGSLQRAGSAFPPDEDRRKEETLAEHWSIKIIKRFIDPRGKKILELRARTGALTAILQAEGAEVLGVEPFQANANYARHVRGLSNVFDLPFSRFHQFPLPQDGQVDVVNVLNHHVLAHVLSPRLLLEKLSSVLKPGGYLFLDEKDVLHPVRHKKRSVLDSGPAHQFQLTVHTTGCYLRSTGFELLECEIDKHRSSDFRHIRIVARKPPEGALPTGLPNPIEMGKGLSLRTIHRRLWWLENTWRIRLARVRVKKKTQRMLRRLGFEYPFKQN